MYRKLFRILFKKYWKDKSQREIIDRVRDLDIELKKK